MSRGFVGSFHPDGLDCFIVTGGWDEYLGDEYVWGPYSFVEATEVRGAVLGSEYNFDHVSISPLVRWKGDA